jgi:predicted alpha/beta hydrolase family esterase
MKKLLILPGNSLQNKAWGEQCHVHFQSQFDEVSLQYYDHWQSDDSWIDIEAELKKLSNLEQGEWYVVAKSVGTILALLAIERQLIQPVKCIFFGMPLDMAEQDIFKGDMSPLVNCSVPILAFHNDQDPIADFSFTKNKLTANDHVQFVQLHDDTHDYMSFSHYQSKIEAFLHHGN